MTQLDCKHDQLIGSLKWTTKVIYSTFSPKVVPSTSDATLGSATTLSVSLPTSIRSSTPWAMPPSIYNTLLVGAPTGLPPSASTLWARTGALAGPPNNLAFTDGTLDWATRLHRGILCQALCVAVLW